MEHDETTIEGLIALENVFAVLHERHKHDAEYMQALRLEAIACACSHGRWDQFYAAKRGAFKAARLPLRGSFLDGTTVMKWLRLRPTQDPEDSGEAGMEALRGAAAAYLEVIEAAQES